MENQADTISSSADWVTFRTPLSTRVAKVMLSSLMLLGAVLLPIGFAIVIYQAAIQLGSPALAACVPAAATYVLSVRLGWQIVTAPIRFQIVFGPETVEIGGGWLRRSYAYDEVEAISLPEQREDGYGIALEAGASGAFVHLTPDDEARCVAILRTKCKNAIFVDRSRQEYLPPSPDQPLLSLGALYRRNRWLALGSVIPMLLVGAICVGQSILLGCVVFGFLNPPISGVLLVVAKLLVELVGLAWLVRFASQRMKRTLIIRAKMAEFRNIADK